MAGHTSPNITEHHTHYDDPRSNNLIIGGSCRLDTLGDKPIFYHFFSDKHVIAGRPSAIEVMEFRDVTNKSDHAGSSPAERDAAIMRIEARVKVIGNQVRSKEAELISISGWTVTFDDEGEATIKTDVMTADRRDKLAEAAIELGVLVEARNHASAMLHAMEASK